MVAIVVALVVALLVAVVVLSLAGKSPADVAALLGVVVVVLGGIVPLLDSVLKIRRETEQQSTVLAEIHENTNGKLDKRIRDAVSQALQPTNPVQPPRRLLAAIEAEECQRRSTEDGPQGTDGGNPYPTTNLGPEAPEHPFED